MALLPPLLEELLFRGFLITELLALMPIYPAVAITSFLFACIHLPYWLARGASIQAVVTNGSAAIAFGILTGALFVKTRSIWPSTLAHIAANIFPQFFV
jgi:membrane protease YdiL (CAAX protease family)